MVRKNKRYLAAIIFFGAFMVSTMADAQTIHFGTQWGLSYPFFQTESKDYHFAYLQVWGENQDLTLEADEMQFTVLSPALFTRFEAKNKWLISSWLQTSAYRLDYKLKTVFSEGFRVRLQTLDYGLLTGIKLSEFKEINIIPEVGVITKIPLAVSERRRDGSEASQETLHESDPQVAGVRSALITNETMDFENLFFFGRAGITVKYYNIYFSAYFDTNLSPVDKRDFYKSASQFSVNVGLDLFSFHVVKNQGRHFDN